MKNILFQISVFLMISISFFSCSENPDEEMIDTLPETKQNLLVGKIWRLTSMQVDPPRAREVGRNPVSDWYADMEPCEQDAQKVYFFNGDLVFDEGPTRCEESDVQTFTGSWTFNSDETIITELQQNFINIIFSYRIIELTTTRMVVERQQKFIADPVTYTFLESYEAI